MIQQIILQTVTTIPTQSVVASLDGAGTDWPSFSTVLSWLSIVMGIYSIFQAYHYKKLSDKTFTAVETMLSEMKTSVTKVETAVLKVETISQVLNDRFFGLFDKTMSQVTKGALNPKAGALTTQEFKKDIEKTVIDSSEKLQGDIKSLTDSVDKNHGHMDEIKKSVKVVADAVQEIFTKFINHIDDFEDGDDDFEYMKKKVTEKCCENAATVKDILSTTSSKIPLTKRLAHIIQLKETSVVNYEGSDLYDHTKVFMEKKLD